jgi:flagellar hook-associated protein 2
MSTISSVPNLGISQSSANSGTGIDVTSVVDQIIYADRSPERIWQAQQQTLSDQSSALNSLNTSLQALQNVVYELTDVSGAFSALTISSTQPGILTGTAQPGAAMGTHLIQVGNLATTSSYYSDPVANSSTTLNPGTITIAVGSGSNATSHDIVIDSTNNTLDKLASYINAKSYGVQASVITDAVGVRLALVSATSGAAGDLNLTGNSSSLVLHKSADGTDAKFTVDGIPLTSGSNTVTGAIPGVTFNLLQQSGTPASLTVAADTNRATQAINSLVSAYNSVITSINTQFATDNSGRAGTLANNSTLRLIQSSLLADVTFAIDGNNGVVNLASMGVDMQNDGTLTVDSAALQDALSHHYADVKTFFSSVSSSGFAGNFKANLTGLTEPATGLIALNLNENSAVQKMLTGQINDLEDRLVNIRQLLTTQYSNVDTMLRQYPVIVQQIQSQLGILSTSK